MAQLLADPVIRGWYLGFCFALLVLPMVGLAWWYHRGILSTPGGRELMQRQNSNPVRPRGSGGDAVRGLMEAASMARDLSSGKYGEHAHAMQKRVYWITGAWVVANAIAFGILMWADEFNRVPPP